MRAPGPRILIAGQPVSALKASFQAQFLNLFQDLQQQLDPACLFELHDVNVVSSISDRVAVVNAGRIVKVAEPNQIHHAPRHPDSSVLLDGALMPVLQARRARCASLLGRPPNSADLPPGCALSDRRAFATGKCQRTIPSLRPDGGGRLTACHRRDEVTLTSIMARG